jgi:hypothetical protein
LNTGAILAVHLRALEPGTRHHDQETSKNNKRRRGQRPEHYDQVSAKNNKRCRGQRPRHHDQAPATQNGRRRGQRPGHHGQLLARRRGQRPGATMKYLRRTTSAAAGSGLGTAKKEYSRTTHKKRRRGQRHGHHGQLPARRRGQWPGATTKYLRRTTSAAAGSSLGTAINERSPTTHNKRRRGQRPGHHDLVPGNN